MIFIENQTKHTFDARRIESIADTLTQRDIELIICDDAAIQKLNHAHRNIDKSTDVLSFPLEGEHAHLPLGTIVISRERAQAKSEELGHTIADEMTLLFVHGLLHLMGYDHETDTGQMRQQEHALIRQFKLPDSLIIRTEDSHD